MNQKTISPDDPRLTAYALNELTPAERAEFEQLLQADPAARRVAEEIGATGLLLSGALEHEPVAPAAGALTEVSAPAASGGGKVIRFPHFYYIVSGLAAACFAVFFSYWSRQYEDTHKHYTEISLSPPPPPPAATDYAVSAESVALPAAEPVEVEHALALREQAAAEMEQRAAAAARLAQGEVAAARMKVSTRQPGPGVADQFAFSRFKQEHEANTEAYAYRKDNEFLAVRNNPLSTFSIDVDTASYANVRRFLNEGKRPPVDAVRIEELVNYFPYRYQPPAGDAPFAANLEVAAAPWAPAHRLVRIGLKGREVNEATRPAANLVFLLDVSGSMQAPNKLPLVKQSLRMLVERLRPDDHVAIAVYAGASGLALPSTPVSHKADILEAIDQLEAGGSTNGAMGIQLAYDIAKANFVSGGINRVILATDGDFNVGPASEGELTRLIEEKAKSGVFLSVLGFGMGNLKDATLEQLADKGNGNYAYIDSLGEARKSLVEQAGGTLVTIAKDVKIQVEFNPQQVQAYRLIGYENRLLAKEDFNNDKVDAGEIGAGHTVTALYEVVPVDAEKPSSTETGVAPLKYQAVTAGKSDAPASGELLTVAVRYKEPSADTSRRLEFPLRDSGGRFEDASDDFKFAAAVAGFGMLLRESPHKGATTLADVAQWGRSGLGTDIGDYRHEFLGLVQRTQELVQ